MEGAFIPAIPVTRSNFTAAATSALRPNAIASSPVRNARVQTRRIPARMTAASATEAPAESSSDDDDDAWPSAEALSQTSNPATVLSTEDIMKVLPHRFPFLLLDRVIAYEPGKRAIGVKAVTISEPFFQGHFPDRPIMPGVLQVEALAQLGGIVMLQPPFVEPGATDVEFFFGGVDRVKWRKPVLPGDTLVMEMELCSFKKSFGIAKMDGKAYVDGKLVVQGQFTLVMVGNK